MRLPAARGRAGLRLAVLTLATFGGMTAAGAIAAPAASAHAVLVSSTPVDGSGPVNTTTAVPPAAPAKK